MSFYGNPNQNIFSSADLYASAPTSPNEHALIATGTNRNQSRSPFESDEDVNHHLTKYGKSQEFELRENVVDNPKWKARSARSSFAGSSTDLQRITAHPVTPLHQGPSEAGSMYDRSSRIMDMREDASSMYERIQDTQASTAMESPFFSPYEEYTPRPRQTLPSKAYSRKSLLGPDAFGFDAQNGDPRVIMGGKGIDRNLPSQMGFAAGITPKQNHMTGYEDDARIELITVPGLGAEYSEEEMHEMKKAKNRKKDGKKSNMKWKSFFQKGKLSISQNQTPIEEGEKTVFNRISPRVAVFVAFGMCIFLATLLYFVIPRVPIFAVQSTTPLIAVPDGSSMQTHHSPTNFSMDMMVNLRADNTANWLTTKLSTLEMDITDLSTFKKVGHGVKNDISLPARKRPVFPFLIHFAYASINSTGDQTYAHWINACGPKYDNTPRQSLNLQLTLRMHVAGLIGEKGTSVQLSDVECPFTLQPDQT